MTITLKSKYTLYNIDKHIGQWRSHSACRTLTPGGVDSQRERRTGSRVIETEVGSVQFSSEECQRFNAQTESAACAVCHRCPAAFMCDSCEQRICASCTLRSSLLPLSCFCSDECKSEAETAADHVQESDPYARYR